MNNVVCVPWRARDSRCGANACTSSAGAVRFVLISSAMDVALMLVGSKRLKDFWMPALIMTVSRVGNEARISCVLLVSDVMSVMSNYLSVVLVGAYCIRIGCW